MNNSNHTSNTDIMRRLQESIESMMDHTSFRLCYERKDPNIRFYIIVAPDRSLAEVASLLIDGSPANTTLEQLVANGTVVGVIPDIFQLVYECAGSGACDEKLFAMRCYMARITNLSHFLDACAPECPDSKTLALLRMLPEWMDAEVLAYYCTPGYVIQFTGRRWE